MNPLANPIQSLLSRAASGLPKTTGETDRFRSRHERAGDTTWIVCDVSGSMADLAWGGRKKIDVLREAVEAVWPTIASPRRLLEFSTGCRECPAPADLAYPAGSTRLDLALGHVAGMSGVGAAARHTLVISDGQPDDEALALAAADRVPGVIDVLYVGPDTDAAAIAFMGRLARAGGGRVSVNDLRREFSAPLLRSIRGLLTDARGGRP